MNQVLNAGNPASMLDNLNELVSNTLHQTQNTQIKEGMDISLCSLDTKNMKLEFAGAYNSLFIVRNKKLIESKGNRFSIGSKHYRGDKKYDNHIIDIQKGDMIYLTTDGYLDQFGGEDSNKYMVYQFRKLILSIADKDSITQKEIITNTFNEWKDDEDQIDDVCVFGVRV